MTLTYEITVPIDPEPNLTILENMDLTCGCHRDNELVRLFIGYDGLNDTYLRNNCPDWT